MSARAWAARSACSCSRPAAKILPSVPRGRRICFVKGRTKMWKTGVLVAIAGWTALWGQQVRLPPGLEQLADKAEESVTVTLDSSMLRLLSKFDKDGDAKKALNGVESVYVRSFE